MLHLTGDPPLVRKGEHTFAGDLLAVDEARELVSMARRRPWQGDSTVIHVSAAHFVREDVWNTLLRLLEEPPPYVFVHLYAPSSDSIPKTIVSRAHVVRESLPRFVPEDASRLVRLVESGDALAILREGDRCTDLNEARRNVESLWAYSVETGRLDIALVADAYLRLARQGVSPRVLMKAFLLRLAIRHQVKHAPA